jgi:hypothetical protein
MMFIESSVDLVALYLASDVGMIALGHDHRHRIHQTRQEKKGSQDDSDRSLTAGDGCTELIIWMERRISIWNLSSFAGIFYKRHDTEVSKATPYISVAMMIRIDKCVKILDRNVAFPITESE